MGTREAMRAAAQTVAETAVEGAAGMGPGSAGEAAALQDGPRAADGAAASARFFPWRFLGMGLLIAWLLLALPQNQPNAPLYPAGGAPGSRPGALPHFGRPRYLGPPPRARSTAG